MGQHVFSQVPKADIPRSSFDRSYNYKTALDASFLYPVYVDEVLPGDTVSLRASLFGRLATPLKPTLDNIHCETFFFFVPARLTWQNWERFMGAQDNPGDSTDFTIPTITAPVGGFTEGSIYDYMGIPTGVAGLEINALPLRAFQLIYNEWFRDQNLQDSLTFDNGDGPDAPTTYNVVRRGKRHDYFTSCLPWPQKSENPVTVPLGLSAPVGITNTQDNSAIGIFDGLGNTPLLAADSTNVQLRPGSSAAPEQQLYADLSQATGFTINQLRQSFAIQKLYERDARGGTRYVESIKAMFGVTSPDFRHQRPEYLGGGHTMVQINPVPQSSGSAPADGYTPTPQGNLAAIGVVADSGHGFTKSFTEHGYIIGLVNFRADLSYQQGLRRMWSRRQRFDHFFPALSHIGEMAVLNKEIYAQGTAEDDDVFGYQEAWGDYRYAPSLITATMRSNAAASLDVWHLAQDFANLPTLNASFIQDNAPIDRIIAVQDEPHFLLDIYYKQRWARPMPLYGVPGLIDHF